LVNLRGQHAVAVSGHLVFLPVDQPLTIALPRYTNSSFGWDPDSKRQELFHTLARFILVYGDEEVLSAFCAFRFEVEDEEDVLYLYVLCCVLCVV